MGVSVCYLFDLFSFIAFARCCLICLLFLFLCTLGGGLSRLSGCAPSRGSEAQGQCSRGSSLWPVAS